jgi:hypothetical protein
MLYISVSSEMLVSAYQDLSDERSLENAGAIKKHVDAIETPFQRIDVYDFVDRKNTEHGSHMRSHNHDDNYEQQDGVGGHDNDELRLDEKKLMCMTLLIRKIRNMVVMCVVIIMMMIMSHKME